MSQQYRNTKARKMDRGTTEMKGKRDYMYHCPHGKKTQFCELCGGSGLCEHKTSKYSCTQCNKGKRKRDWTKYNCEHGKRKIYCELCGGNGLCEHSVVQYTCTKCRGSDICKHGKQKHDCTKGCGGFFCEHVINKKYCRDSDGNKLCKTPHCLIRKNLKYAGYCWYCFANMFPDKPVVRNYRTKEDTVATFLKEKFLMLPGSTTRV